MLKIYTSNIRYKGDDRLDITVKSGVQAFAPQWGMVFSIKKGKITEKQYNPEVNDIGVVD